ncbi:kinase-like domain-containing protein [Podospora didyma]|uniref:Kinase-like domain-containing protein n=1 Tax=Podospora didyma TaxID=330526 RepID=A0AAE0NRP2_9PEZI|nr:kinase-like domain-containing protein [Podospora didyma]
MPLNEAARLATAHYINKDWQYQLDPNTFGLWIDFSDPDRPAVTLGRADADIYLPEQRLGKFTAGISAHQATFELVPETGAVLLWDNSDVGSTEPYSPPTSSDYEVKFRPNSAKSVLVAKGINSHVGFGRDKWYKFEIRWVSVGLYDFPMRNGPYMMGPRKSQTKRYVEGDKVGGGAYGNVWWALDVVNGTLMAVKKFHNMSGKPLEFATREVANLFKINNDTSIQHVHILPIYGSAMSKQAAAGPWGEIFMPLKSGNLKNLVEKAEREGEDLDALAGTVLHQMLLALQCIALHNIVHRDIKPENILWEYDENNKYHFYLGDFGLSHNPELAKTVAGTEVFMAPEVFYRKKQTTNVDMWSLFATYVWVRDSQFRNNCSQYGAPYIHRWLVHISERPEYASTRMMASMDARKRPTAGMQLAILDGTVDYGGDMAVGGSDEVSEKLGGEFSGMNLEDVNPGMTYGSGSSDMPTSPEVPYYEPYADFYPLESPGGPSKGYEPPPAGESNAPRDHRVRYADLVTACYDVLTVVLLVGRLGCWI